MLAVLGEGDGFMSIEQLGRSSRASCEKLQEAGYALELVDDDERTVGWIISDAGRMYLAGKLMKEQ